MSNICLSTIVKNNIQYWCDENNNLILKSECPGPFLAQYHFNTLKNCKNCIECFNCSDCSDCEKCINCSECENSSNLTNCHKCKNEKDKSHICQCEACNKTGKCLFGKTLSIQIYSNKTQCQGCTAQ